MIPSSTSWTWEREGRFWVFSEIDLGVPRLPLRPAWSVVVECSECIVDCWGNDGWNADTSDDVNRAVRMQSVVVSLIVIFLYILIAFVFFMRLKKDR